MTFLYSEKYLPGVTVFRIYTLNLLLRCTYFGLILNSYGQTRQIFYCSLISLGLNIVLNPVLFRLLGVPGPAVATFLAIFLIMLLQLKMSCRFVGCSFADIFPWKPVGRIILLNGCFALAFWMLKRLLPLEIYLGPVVEAITLGVVWSAAYLLMEKKRILSLWDALNKKGEAE